MKLLPLLLAILVGMSGYSQHSTSEFYVKNCSETDQRVHIVREEVSEVDGSWSLMVFNVGFNPWISTTIPQMIDAGDSLLFQVNYDAEGTTDTSTHHYCFYIDDVLYQDACRTISMSPSIPNDTLETMELGCGLINAIPTISKPEMRVFPNPAIDEVNFMGKFQEVEVRDNMGWLIFRSNRPTSANTTEWATGTYHVRFVDAGGLTINTSLVVNH